MYGDNREIYIELKDFYVVDCLLQYDSNSEFTIKYRIVILSDFDINLSKTKTRISWQIRLNYK